MNKASQRLSFHSFLPIPYYTGAHQVGEGPSQWGPRLPWSLQISRARRTDLDKRFPKMQDHLHHCH